MKWLVFLIELIFCSIQISAQGLNNIWFLDRDIGLNFGDDPPSLVSGSILEYIEANTTVSIGNDLLFYSNGEEVIDARHQTMLNGQQLRGSRTSTQGCKVVKVSEHTYYLFTLTEDGILSYSIIDMRLNDGYGAILPDQKNVMVMEGTSEKLQAIRGNCGEAWLLTTTNRLEPNSNSILAFRIDISGITETVSTPLTNSGRVSFEAGQIVGHPSGRIAIVTTEGGVLFGQLDLMTGRFDQLATVPV